MLPFLENDTRLPGRPSAFLIVPPEHRLRGAPPVAAWLDDYFRAQGQRYSADADAKCD